MSFLSSIGDLLQQYRQGNSPSSNPATVEQHFDQVTQALPASSIAGGLAEAFRSGQTPAFPQMAGQLFSNGNSGQQATMLSGLLAAVAPGVISAFTGSNPQSPLTSLLRSGQTSVTPAQAASIPAADVQSLAQHAHEQDPSVIDRMSAIYAQHPQLVKGLGAAVMAIAVQKIAQNHPV